MAERFEASLENVKEYQLTIPAESMLPRLGTAPVSEQTSSRDDAVIFALTDFHPNPQGKERSIKVTVNTFELPGERKGIFQICYQGEPIVMREIEVVNGYFEGSFTALEMGMLPQDGNAAPWSYQLVLFRPEVADTGTILESMRTKMALNIRNALASPDHLLIVKSGENVSKGPIDFSIEKENDIGRAKIHVEHGTPVQRGRIILKHQQGQTIYYWDLPAKQWKSDAGTEGDFELKVPAGIQLPEEEDTFYELEIFEHHYSGTVYR